MIWSVSRACAGLILALAGNACAQTAPDLPVRPVTPGGWVSVASDTGDLRVELPSWIHTFDTRGAIFANEVVARGRQGIQVMAVGPLGDGQPSPGESVPDWLQRRIASPVAGPATVRTVAYPSGSAIVVERVDAAGTPDAWRIAAYAFRAPTGIAILVIDGPEAAWTTREQDLALIPQLVTFGAGRAGAQAVPIPWPGTAPSPAAYP